ncbi:putative beta-galactosidase [Paenibacillus sp. 598K]|nr:putative beta-galactosidase [Paenibacillus sp. 598K]
MRAGVKEMNNQHVRTMLPGRLAGLTGIRVEEYDAIGHDRHTLVDDRGRAYGCTQWCDILRLEGAEAIASYEGDFYDGTPAVTVHRYGQGRAYYVATHPDEAYLRQLLLRAAAEQGMDAVTDLPEGVQLAQRTGESGTYLFALNLSREPRELRLPGSWERLLGGEGADGELKLEPYGVEILRRVSLD